MKINWLQWSLRLAFLFTYLVISLYRNTTILIHYPYPAIIGVMQYKYRRPE